MTTWEAPEDTVETQDVQRHFREQVPEYSELMQRIIPYYEEQRDILLRLIPFDADATPSILDLGCGPGLLAVRLLDAYPHARLTAFDLTEEMLDACRARVGDGHHVTYRQGDFRSDTLGSGLDVIVASLSLHHLEVAERPSFYERALESLRPGGLLIAAEVIVDEAADVRERQYEAWRQFMRDNGEDGDAWFDRHQEKDHPCKLERMLDMLRRAGFAEAGCVWRYLNFAIVSARVPCS